MKKNLSFVVLSLTLLAGPAWGETTPPAMRWFDMPERGPIARPANGSAPQRADQAFLPLSAASTHAAPTREPAAAEEPGAASRDAAAGDTTKPREASAPGSTAASGEMDEVLRARHIYEIFAAH